MSGLFRSEEMAYITITMPSQEKQRHSRSVQEEEAAAAAASATARESIDHSSRECGMYLRPIILPGLTCSDPRVVRVSRFLLCDDQVDRAT